MPNGDLTKTQKIVGALEGIKTGIADIKENDENQWREIRKNSKEITTVGATAMTADSCKIVQKELAADLKKELAATVKQSMNGGASLKLGPLHLKAQHGHDLLLIIIAAILLYIFLDYLGMLPDFLRPSHVNEQTVEEIATHGPGPAGLRRITRR